MSAAEAPRGPGRFFFVRHGETSWNREGRLQGQHEAELNALGLRQAEAAGAILARLLADRGLRAADRHFVASPLSRTRDTMRLVRDALGGHAWIGPRMSAPPDGERWQDRVDGPARSGLGGDLPPVHLDDRLKEIGFGAWEGRTWEGLKRAEPAAIAERRRDTWGFVPPGGESYAMLLDRLSPWLAGLPADAVVVAHGGVARALLHRVAGVGRQRATAEEIHQGRVLLFEDGAARWI